ncbi:MAG: MOSC N-terminal beta barrel domain-containing protein [Bacteroidota bacterium]
MLTISQLYTYPVKSMGGIDLTTARLTDRGFEYDRRWMLVDQNNRFISQRESPRLALLQPGILADGLSITHKINGDQLIIPFTPKGENITAVIWDDICELQLVDPAADAWLSNILERSCRLVYMPDNCSRRVDDSYSFNGELTSLSDAYPLLMIGQSSLDDLNSRLDIPVPMNRFRPNIVFTGGEPYHEDDMSHFAINGINLYGVKPCARCPIPTIDQNTAIASKEPIKTLATYRARNNKVYFGQNLLFDGGGVIRVGDLIID